MLELTEQMYNAVLNLDDDYRQFFCLKHCQEQDTIYLLKEKGANGMPLLFEDAPEDGDDSSTFHMFLPIWCHPRFIEYYLESSDAHTNDNFEIVELKLSVFKEKWVPSLKNNMIALALLPLEQDKNFSICPADIFENEDAAKAAAEYAASLDKVTEADMLAN